MPQQFLNTTSTRPMSIEESRKRIQSLVNAGKKVTNHSDIVPDHVEPRVVGLARGVDQRVPTSFTPSQLRDDVPAEKKPEDPQYEQKTPSIQTKEAPLMPPSTSAVEPVTDAKVEPAYPFNDARYWNHVWSEMYEDKLLTTEPARIGSEKKVVLLVSLPQDNEIEIAAAEQMFASLTGLTNKPNKVFNVAVGLFPQTEILFKNPTDSISFEISANEERISFQVVVAKKWADYVERQIHGAYPDAEISEADETTLFPEQGSVHVHEFELKGKVFYPIRMYDEFEVDTLNALTSVVSKLTGDERVVLQVVTQPADDVWRKRGQHFVQLAQSPATDGQKKASIDPAVLEAVTKKVSRAGYRIVIRVIVCAPNDEASQIIMQNILGSFDQYSLPHLAIFEDKPVKLNHQNVATILNRSFPQWGNYPVLNTTELATVFHFPSIEVKTPRIAWLRTRTSAPPTNIPKEGLFLGKSEFRNSVIDVHILRSDRRRHMYTIGQTGSGKSEFLKHMAYQDIINGEGLAFIDPHGETVEDLLAMVPKERAEDVVYFNPSDYDRPMGINILEADTEEQKHQAINSFISLLYKLYDPNRTGMVGPQLERAVRNVMLTAMSEPGNTLIEVLKLLTNPKFAEKKIPLIDDPMVKSYWTEQIAQTSDAQKSETLGYFVSKFDRFVTEKLMRNIIGQSRSAFKFRDIMDNKKIFLANLSKGKIGEENSTFLGLLLVPRILVAAMSRAELKPEDRKDFYLYVDEFQNFSTPDFAEILAEARKYRLNLIVANQYIAQIQEDIRNAVFGNVGTMCSFRIGADDAEYMEKQFDPVFSQRDLINLGIGEVSTRLLIEGQPSRPFSFKTDWEIIKNLPRNEKVGEVIKEISRLKYGRDRRVIESEIAVRAEF